MKNTVLFTISMSIILTCHSSDNKSDNAFEKLQEEERRQKWVRLRNDLQLQRERERHKATPAKIGAISWPNNIPSSNGNNRNQ